MAAADAPRDEADTSALPGDGPFFRRIAKRKARGRDAVITVTAKDADRGVGKTALATTIARLLDTSASGFDAEEKATLDVPRFLGLYDEVEEGSVIVLDEAEQLDSRRSNSHENVDASHRMQTRRVNEVIAVLTLPSRDVMDKRIELLTDFWIEAKCRGRSVIYKKGVNSMSKQLYFSRLQTFQWPNLDGENNYESLATKKQQFIDDESRDDNWIRKDEHDKKLEQAKQEVAKKKRNEMLRKIYTALEDNPDFPTPTYPDFAANLDLHHKTVGDIIRGG